MTIKITILGTSNSIIKNGYIDGMNTYKDIEIIKNLSIGSSQASVIPFRLSDHNISETDVIIIDICVNEQRALQRGGYNESYSDEIFQYLLSECAKHNTIPFILLMPEMNNDDNTPKHLLHRMRNFYINLCSKYQIPYFDGYSYIEKISVKNNTQISVYFEDKNHVRSDQAINIGKCVSEILIKNFPKWIINKNKEFIHLFEYKKLESNNKVLRKTNIIQIETNIITNSSEKITMCSTAKSDVTGIVFNMSQSNASIKIVGANSLVKILANSYTQPDRPLWLVAWSFLGKVTVPDNGKIEISCDPTWNSISAEQHDHGRIRPEYRGMPPVIEIAGLVFRLPKAMADIISIENAEIDTEAYYTYR